MAEHEYQLTGDGCAFPGESLITALDEFVSTERYSSRRDQILRKIKNQPFRVDLVFHSAERTYGYTSDDRFRGGLTVLAAIKDTSHLVSLQMPSASNDQLASAAHATPLSVTLIVTKWNSVSEAFLALFALDVPHQGVDQEQPVDAPPSPTADVAASRESDLPEDTPVPDYPVDPPSEPSPDDTDPPAAKQNPPPPTDTAAADEDDSPPASPTPSIAPSDSSVIDLTENLHVPRPDAVPSTPPVDSPPADVDDEALTVNSKLLEQTNGTTPLSARSLSEFIGYKLDIDPDVVDRATTSFWSHYLSAARFMDGQLHVSVPFIGRFSLFRRTGGSIGVTLQQVDIGTLSAAAKRITNMHKQRDDWVADYQATGSIPHDDRHGSATVAIQVSEENDLDLATSYKLVLELMTLLTTLFSLGTRRLRFPSIGEFYPVTGARGNPVYKFRVYKSLLRMLSSIPLEKYAALVGAQSEDGDLTIHKRHPSQDQKQGAWGCLGIIAVILFFVFFINDGCSDVMREFGSLENTPAVPKAFAISDHVPSPFEPVFVADRRVSDHPIHVVQADRQQRTTSYQQPLLHAHTTPVLE